jgi:hypothetical protein
MGAAQARTARKKMKFEEKKIVKDHQVLGNWMVLNFKKKNSSRPPSFGQLDGLEFQKKKIQFKTIVKKTIRWS